MDREQILKYAPELLAAYVSVVTILYLGCVYRFVVTLRQFGVAQLIRQALVNLPALCFIQGCGRALHFFDQQPTTTDERFRLFSIILLGYFLAVCAAYGFVAAQFPEAWQHYQALARVGEEAERAATKRRRLWSFPRRKDERN